MGWTRFPQIMFFMCLAFSILGLSCSDSTSAPSDGAIPCSQPEDCPVGQDCIAGICQPPGGDPGPRGCESDAECPEGWSCRDGTCAEDPDGGLDGGDDVAPEPDIEILEPPLTGSPPVYQIDFGSVAVGQQVARPVRLRNVGNADLTVTDLFFENQTPPDFFLDSTTTERLPIVVPPGTETQFEVQYLARDGMDDSGILDILSTDPDEARVPIQLLSSFKGTVDALVVPDELGFGDIPVGGEAMSQLTLSNQGTGNAVLRVEGMQLASLGGSVFELTGLPGFPLYLNRGDQLDITVWYHPDTLGDHTDRVILATNDPDSPRIEVPLDGRGVVPDLWVEPAPVDLGEVRFGSRSAADVALSNRGGAPLSIVGLSLAASTTEFDLSSDPVTGFDLSTLSPANPVVLQTGESRMISVGYTPADVGIDQATLLIDSPQILPSPREVAVSASGYIPPAIGVEPGALDFGDLHVRGRSSLPIIVRNDGERFLVVDDIRVNGGLGSFSFLPSALPSLGPGDEAILDVAFAPTTIGGRGADLELANNDPDRPLVDVQLIGNAIDPNIFILPIPPLVFPTLYRGQAADISVFVTNAGVGPLVIQDISISIGSSSDFSLVNVPGLPATLANSSEYLTFEVHYAPMAVGADSGAVRVDSSDLDAPVRMLELQGEAIGCPTGSWDIDGNPANGCEYLCTLSNGGSEACDFQDNDCDMATDENFNFSTDPANCGTCNRACSFPHAEPLCVSGDCSMGTCNDGFWDDNRNSLDGCEYACTPTGGGTEVCDHIDNDCDGDTDEDTNTGSDVNHCGSCGNACSLYNATPVCQSGNCAIGACDAGFDNCDGLQDNGCETDLMTDANNCNGCGNQCTFPNAPPLCVVGVCTPGDCSSGFLDCDGDPGNGCEANINTDPVHCGACGHGCGDPSEACVNGLCHCGTIGPDCVGSQTCCGIACVELPSDEQNCGQCGNACQTGELCTTGTCSCGGTGPDCPADQICCGNGCFDPLSSGEHCGSCTNACDANESCVLGACRCGGIGMDCLSPFSCCGALCVDLSGSNNHCGACGHACDTGELCIAGACKCGGSGSDCGTGQTCCGTLCVDTLSSEAHCGSCFVGCDPSESCESGMCRCGGSGADCTGSLSCCGTQCVDLALDESHCGACGSTCDTGEYCVNGLCQCGGVGPNCSAPLSCCGSTCVNLASSPSNCGVCGTECDSGESCVSGGCKCGGTGSDCTPGQSCCGFNCVDVLADESNCGGCGHLCDAGEQCINGSCRCGGTGSDCSSTQLCCATACVDPSSDEANCGACGVTCDGNEFCSSGQCRCGGSGPNCSLPQVCCGSSCVDLASNNSNCGGCGVSCDAGESCTSGQCRCGGTGANCGGGQTCCGTDCVSLLTDGSNCGSCNYACDPGEVCSNGVCRCGGTGADCLAGQTCCGTACVNLLSDEATCGSCSVACDPNETCENGVCRCGSVGPDCSGGLTCCGSACVDMQTDRSHCGSCPNVCQAGQYCHLGVCTPGCIDDGDCGGLKCCGGQCVDVSGNNLHCGACNQPCGTGESCASGVCRCGGTGPDCTGGQICCGTTCTDPLTDPAHCGNCTTACDANEQCTSGLCKCGGSGPDCGPGTLCCGTQCFDPLTSEEHCGNCATSCDSGEFCTSGTCLCGGTGANCTTGQLCCGTSCINPTNDPNNCGGCGIHCDNGEQCISGSCRCGGTGSDCTLPIICCGTSCVDPASNNLHCGGCSQPCDTGESCSGGSCKCGGSGPNCSAPLSCCGTSCVNLANDSANCGTCGFGCNANAYCSGGACACNNPFGNCDGSWSTGCEINTSSNVSHCGGCNQACALAHVASHTCVASVCHIAACSASWHNLNTLEPDGCECADSGNESSGTTCESAINLGQLHDTGTSGRQVSYVANLSEAGDEDWYVYTALDDADTTVCDSTSGAVGETYDLNLTLSPSASEFEITVYKGACPGAGGTVVCDYESGGFREDFSGTYATTWVDPPSGLCPCRSSNQAGFRRCDFGATGSITLGGTYYVRVRRPSSWPSGGRSCTSYTLAISNGY